MRNILRAYWPSMRKHWTLLFLTLCLMVATVYLKTLAPYYVRDIVNIFMRPRPDVVMAKNLFMEMLILFIGFNIIHRSWDLAITFYEARVMRELDQRSFAAIQAQSIHFFENSFSGSLVKYVTRFRNSFETITDILILELGRNLVTPIFIILIFAQAMPSFAIAFGIWSIAFIGIGIIAAILKYPLDTANAASDTMVGGAIADSISNHLTVKSFGYERSEQKRFNLVVEDNYRKRLRSWLCSNLIVAIQGIMMAVAELGLLWWMINGFEQGTITVADFIFFQAYVIAMLTHLWPFGHSVRKLFQSFADAQEMADVYNLIPEVRDCFGAPKIIISEGAINMHEVRFSYGSSVQEHPTLKDFSLRVPAGQSIGIVGKTGAGKTTIAKLLLRLYDISYGSIRIDGQDIGDVTQESLRQQLAVVPQQPQLFHRSIGENIGFARPGATLEEIIEAAKKAHAWGFIQRLPYGLDTLVGERGVKLSGGQAQRIAIARAILADPRILILDEATSAVDSVTEKHIQLAIGDLLQKRTSIVIAHRLSTIMQLDRIIVMKDGKIVEDGTHEELLALNGYYTDLWKHQIGGYIK